MRKLLLIWLMATFYILPALAQQQSGYNKLGASLKLLLAEKPAESRFFSHKDGRKYLSVILETSSGLGATSVRKNGYSVRTTMGTVSTMDVLVEDIYNLAQMSVIKRIELPLLLHKTDTIMTRFTTVENVLMGQTPLDKPYTGRNILIGVIDDGIDISHPDFYAENGKLRISHLWNMDNNGLHPPNGFSYGREWTRDSMEYYAEQFRKKRFDSNYMRLLFGSSGHGTPVTSLAAGNKGVAPEAEIVSVALTSFADTLLRSDRVIDGIAYIYRIAQLQNKKCIINISLGVMDGGPHDGKTLLEKAIDNFSNEHPDILVCTSAGNNGNSWKHWGGFPIHRDSSFGFFSCSGEASLYFTIPRHDSKNLRISIAESKLGSLNNPNVSKDSVYYQSPFLNIDSLINSPEPAIFRSRLPNGNTSSYITFTASRYNEDYDELIIKTNEQTSTQANPFDSHLYRFIIKGEGSVHAWYPFWNLHPVFMFNRNPFPNDPTYYNTDNEYTSGIPSNAFTVLSSGAYNIRSCYVNLKGKVVNQYEKCRTTYFTSHGPTLDGRIKPDILSPGDNVMAARSSFLDFLDHEFIVDLNTVSFGGTSASSPITAGIAALIWEKFPGFTRDSVIKLIKTSANFDSFSSAWGDQPNNVAGWGKTDAFSALTGVRIDNHLLCLTNDVCVGKIEPPVTMPPPPIPPPVNEFRIFPNPADKEATISYISDKPIKFSVFDASGRLMVSKSLPVSSGRLEKLDLQQYATGIYFIKVIGWQTPFVKKIFVSGNE